MRYQMSREHRAVKDKQNREEKKNIKMEETKRQDEMGNKERYGGDNKERQKRWERYQMSPKQTLCCIT